MNPADNGRRVGVVSPERRPKVVQAFYVGRAEGGGEVHARTLQAAFEQRGIESTSVCFLRDAAADPAAWTTLTPESRQRQRSRLIWHPIEAARFLRRERPDAILCHTLSSAWMLLPIAAMFGITVRVNVHHAPLHRWGRGARLMMLADLVMGSTGLATTTLMVAQVGVRSVKGYPAPYRRRVKLILNQVPPIELTDRASARSRFGLIDDEPCVIFVGRRTVAKGADLAAASASIALGETGWLLVAGDPGDADPALHALIDSGARVRLLGPLDRSELGRLFSAADLLLFTSRAENRPLTLLEAAGCGLSIVARDLPETREAFHDETTPSDPVPTTSGQPHTVQFVEGDDSEIWAHAIRSGLLTEVPDAGTPDAESFKRMIDAYMELVTRGLQRSESAAANRDRR